MGLSKTNIGQFLRQTKFALAIVLAMHGYLLVAAWQQQSYLTDDSVQYLTIAENLTQGGVFSQSYAAPLSPDVQRTPGYPVFIYLMGRNCLLILVMQHIICLFSGVLIYGILLMSAGKRWAMYGAFLYLLQPYSAILASYILSETLFIFLLLAWLWMLLKFWRGDGLHWMAASLACLSLAALVRPVALPLLILVMVVMLVKALRDRRRWWMALAAILFVPAMILGPWLVRNHQRTNQWSLSTMGPMGMLHGRLGGLEAWRKGYGTDEHYLYMLGDSIAALEIGLPALRNYPLDKQTHETEQLAAGMSGLTFNYFWHHPLDAILFQLNSIYAMLKGVGYGWATDLTHTRLAAILLAGMQLVLNILNYLGVLAALRRYRQWRAQEWMAFGAMVLILLVSSAAWADGRYRAVVDPLMVLLTVFVIQNYELDTRGKLATITTSTGIQR